MTPGPASDRLLLTHMRECIERIREYTAGDRSRFETSHLVQDAVIRNLQTLTESSQRLSDGIKATEPQVPWRDGSGLSRRVAARRRAMPCGRERGGVWSRAPRSL